LSSRGGGSKRDPVNLWEQKKCREKGKEKKNMTGKKSGIKESHSAKLWVPRKGRFLKGKMIEGPAKNY